MGFLDTLAQRNQTFAETGFPSDLTMLPSKKTLLVGCVDPRVDPATILGLDLGEVAVIRNIGGRVNAALFETMAVLGSVALSQGQEIGPGWNLVVLHHTDCGIVGCYERSPQLLAKYLGVTAPDLETMAIADPYEAIRLDIVKIKANPNLPGAFTVTGLVYDVASGRVETVVPPTLLREEPS